MGKIPCVLLPVSGPGVERGRQCQGSDQAVFERRAVPDALAPSREGADRGSTQKGIQSSMGTVNAGCPRWASLGRSAAWLAALGAPLPPRAELTACAGGPAPRENTLVRLTCFWLTWSNPPKNERQLRLRLDKGWDGT